MGLGGEGGWGWCQGGPSPPLWVSLAERLERKSPSGWMYRQDPSSWSAGLPALPLGSHGAWCQWTPSGPLPGPPCYLLSP